MGIMRYSTKIFVFFWLHHTCFAQEIKINWNGGTIVEEIKFPTCPECPEIVRLDSNEPMQNISPRFSFKCSAFYPIDWKYHFDETFRTRNILQVFVRHVSQREAFDFDDPSSYEYSVTVGFTSPISLISFPNFTCHSTDNPGILTRLVLSSNGSQINMESSTHANDYLSFPAPKPQGSVSCPVLFKMLGPPVANFPLPCFSCQTTNGTLLVPGIWGCGHPNFCEAIYTTPHLSKDCVMETKDIEGYGSCPRQHLYHYTICDEAKDRQCIFVKHMNPFIVTCSGIDGVEGHVLGFHGVTLPIAREENPLVFTTLAEPRIYFRWEDLEPEDMVKIGLLNDASVLYVGETTNFQCIMSVYYCSRGVWYTLEANDLEKPLRVSGILLGPDRVDISDQDNKIFLRSREHSVSLPVLDVFKGNLTITCHCPVYNTQGWINSSFSVTVLDPEEPQIISVTTDNGNAEWYVGESNHSITCKWVGAPMKASDISWEFNDMPKNATTMTVDLAKNETTLMFVGISSSLERNYTCKIGNYLGQDEQSIFITVKDSVSFFSSTTKKVVLISGVAIATISFIALFLLLKFYQRRGRLYRSLTDTEVKEFFDGKGELLLPEDQPYDREYELEEEALDFDEDDTNNPLAAQGEFSTVKLAKLNNDQVAVKELRSTLTTEEFKVALREIKFMMHIGGHSNVVAFIGACTSNISNRHVLLVFEHCPKGSLAAFLSSEENLSRFHRLSDTEAHDPAEPYGNTDSFCAFDSLTLLKWTKQVGSGLNYVHSKKIIHRDVASRNVLLTSTLTAKLCDLGLARSENADDDVVRKGVRFGIPWRYAAPEVLQNFAWSTASDTWAFGILLWEIFSLGRTPYEGHSYDVSFTNAIQSGMRLPRPEYSTEEMYKFIAICWSLDPEQRPNIQDVQEIASSAIQKFQPRDNEQSQYTSI